MTESEVRQLMATYRYLAPPGWTESAYLPGELPLPPADALRLADDLEALGIAIMAVDGWSYADDKTGVVEQLVHFYVGDDVLTGDDAASRSVALVKEYISTGFPDPIPLVAFTIHVAPVSDLSSEQPEGDLD